MSPKKRKRRPEPKSARKKPTETTPKKKDNAVSSRPESGRRLFKETKLRIRETKKLLRRARRALSPELRAEIEKALLAVRAAYKERSEERVHEGLDALEPLVDKHLARFRKSVFREYAESIGLAVLFALMLRAFVVEAFQIPSESMVPTLLIGDHLFVNKFVYGVRIPFTRYDIIDFGDPEPGDVVVFIYPVEEVSTQHTIWQIMARLEQHGIPVPETLLPIGMDQERDAWGRAFEYQPSEDRRSYQLKSLGPDGLASTGDDLTNENSALTPANASEIATCLMPENLTEAKDYIKRVIGVAGDRIYLNDGLVYINDVPIEREIISEGTCTDARSNRPYPLYQARETLNDETYIVQFCGTPNDFREITVREGYIFVMGDNRNNSSDSRCWGQVPIENVKGEALFIFWSGGDGGGFLNNRWERMLNSIN